MDESFSVYETLGRWLSHQVIHLQGQKLNKETQSFLKSGTPSSKNWSRDIVVELNNRKVKAGFKLLSHFSFKTQSLLSLKSGQAG